MTAWVSEQEAGYLISVTPSHIRRLVKAGHLEGRRTHRGTFLVDMEQFGAEPPKRRATIPEDVRRYVIRRDGHVCQNCGVTVYEGSRAGDWERPPLHLDHVIPWSKGGPDTADNLRVFCGFCNSRRGNRS